jgi:hypothetical protein
LNGYLEGHLFFDNERFFYVYHLESVSKCVAILGLNSAWLAQDDKDRNRLALGERQVRDALA